MFFVALEKVLFAMNVMKVNAETDSCSSWWISDNWVFNFEQNLVTTFLSLRELVELGQKTIWSKDGDKNYWLVGQ